MTPLRQRMVEDMQLRGLSEKTQEAYVRAVRQLAEHYGESPDRISEEELRQYFLYLKNDKQVSRNTFGVALNGIKFFYRHTLRQEWPTLNLVRPARENTLPVVLRDRSKITWYFDMRFTSKTTHIVQRYF